MHQFQLTSKQHDTLQAQVTEYVTRPGGKDLVRVNIYVEAESQKGIVIGSKGSALKKLSTASRLAIEEFLGRSSGQMTP